MTAQGRETGAYEGWALLELMGRRQRVGYVTEVEMCGGKLLRIDIPIADTGENLTEFYGASAIYSLRPCSEEIAKEAARHAADPRPVKPADYREPRALFHHANELVHVDEPY